MDYNGPMGKKKGRLARLKSRFRLLYRRQPPWLSQAPSRINLIGEHTDYTGGLVLPFAGPQSLWVLAAPSRDRLVRFYSLQRGRRKAFELARCGRPHGGDDDYARGVWHHLSKEGVATAGCDLLVDSEVPLGAGMSSSAALLIALTHAALALAGVRWPLKKKALFCQRVENEFIGVQCGVMDMFAILSATKDQAVYLDCRDLTYQRVPLKLKASGVSLFLAHTGVKRVLAGSPYNERRRQAQAALDWLRQRGVCDFRGVSSRGFMRMAARLPALPRRRAFHVISENERVEQAARWLEQNRFDKVGGLMSASHRSLRENYEVTCPQLDLLFETAVSEEGVYGARMMGAGFGGGVLVLCRREAQRQLQAKLAGAYRARFARPPRFYDASPSPGASVRRLG